MNLGEFKEHNSYRFFALPKWKIWGRQCLYFAQGHSGTNSWVCTKVRIQEYLLVL